MSKRWRLLIAVSVWLLCHGAEANGQRTTASWYSSEACTYWEKRGRHDCPTASGQSLYDLEEQGILFLATWDYPLGTKVRVTHGSKSVEAVVLDRGPARRLVRNGRRWDLSRALFAQVCGNLSQGVCAVEIEEVRP